MFIIVKIVDTETRYSKLSHDTHDYYLAYNNLWTPFIDKAKPFRSESEVDALVEQLNKKADKHYCNSMEEVYQVTTYLKQEI